MRKLTLPSLAAILGLFATAALAQTGDRAGDIPDIDRRDSVLIPAARPNPAQIRVSALVAGRNSAAQNFVAAAQRALPGLRVSLGSNGLPRTLLRDGLALSAPSSDTPEAIARGFLKQNSRLFPFTTAEVDAMTISMLDVTPSGTYLALTQTLGGIPVFEGQVKFTLTRSGEILQAGAGEVLPAITANTTPKLTASDAEQAAKSAFTGKAPAIGQFIRTPELVIFPLDPETGKLAYRLFFEADGDHLYEILIDAADASVLYRHNVTVKAAAQARIWKQSPIVGERELVDLPADWLPDTATVSTGNNVDAWIDADGNDRPDTTIVADIVGGRASSPSRVFDFTFGDGTTGANPRNSKAAAVTNLFYFVNLAHDYFYGLGFTETAANFQTDNFGKGGVAGDSVIAQAQHSGNANNASFSPTPEGTQPRMRVGIFTRGTAALTDDLDADYDGQVLIHEYGHGVSTRLVGAGRSTSCLARLQSSAMGEGWSDYFAISYYNNPVLGAYVIGRASGLRRQSYEGYTFTFEHMGNSNSGYEEHADGEIWAATLWDLRTALGQKLTDALVIAGLKGTPCNPTMLEARDAILSADGLANAGANRAKIWQVFARHGMGSSAAAIEGTLSTGILYDAAFDLPADLQATRGPAITSKPLAIVPGLGDRYNYTVSATNPSGGTLSYSLSVGPPGMSVDPATGVVSWVVGFTSPRVKIDVIDGKGGRVSHGYLAPVKTRLSLGTPLVVSGSTGSNGSAYVEIPADTAIVQFQTRNGGGDADLYVTDPSGRTWISGRPGSTETLSFARPAAGRWDIDLDGYSAYTDLSLVAFSITPEPLSPNATIAGLGGVVGSETLYRIPVPADAASLTVNTSGGTGDLDLYMRQGSPVLCQSSDNVSTPCNYTVRSAQDGNNELITLTSPASGDWYLNVSGFDNYSGVTLKTRLTLKQPDLSVALSHSGVFTQGQKDATFTIVVSNVGAVDTTGDLSVAAKLPAGFTATALSGEGWNCVVSTVSCSRGDVLKSGASLPTIVLKADVPANAAASALGSVTVSGGGQSNVSNDTATDLVLIGNGGPAPTILTGGVGPVYSSSTTIQPGSWVSIYGSNFAAGVTEWSGDFPTSLGGVTVTINGKPAYIWFVSPGQINLQAPDDSAVGPVDVVIQTGNGTTTAKVTLAPAGPSFSLLGDGKHVAGVIATPDGSGKYGGGAYDLVGPAGAFLFNTRPVRVGETLILYGVGFGPTTPAVPAGKVFSGAAPLTAQATVTIGGIPAKVLFAGVTGAGLYQFNVVVPTGLTPGEKIVRAVVPGALTPIGPLLTVQ